SLASGVRPLVAVGVVVVVAVGDAGSVETAAVVPRVRRVGAVVVVVVAAVGVANNKLL
ncbi:MAG: hypothetical protein RL685_7454, partial [Pseudomonadota bacterium]